MPEIRGTITAKDRKLCIVASRFNGLVTQRLVEGALEAIAQHGGDTDGVDVFWVPGSMEIPIVLRAVATKKKYDGVIALGCIVRGDTPHFELVAQQVARNITRLQLEFGLPISFGIVTADSMDQALERAGGKRGNRGREAALFLLETLGLLEKI